jgi:hypothetical protein
LRLIGRTAAVQSGQVINRLSTGQSTRAIDALQQGNGTMIAGLVLGIAVAALAAGAVLVTWLRYGQLAMAAPAALADCPEVLEMRYRIVEFGRNGDDGDTTRGNVVTLPVRPRLAPLHPGLRAAA